MKFLFTILFVLAISSCEKPIEKESLNGKWQVLIDDGEYYERWVNDSLVVWLNSAGVIQTWITEISGNELRYLKAYDRSFDEVTEASLIEKIKVKKGQVMAEIIPTKNSYKLVQINQEIFVKDFRKLDYHAMSEEFKKRQYDFFRLKLKE